MAAGPGKAHPGNSLLELSADRTNRVPIHGFQSLLLFRRNVSICKDGIRMSLERVSKLRIGDGAADDALNRFQCRSSHLPSGETGVEGFLFMSWRAMLSSSSSSSIGG